LITHDITGLMASNVFNQLKVQSKAFFCLRALCDGVGMSLKA
jgi:hypothetical protein